MKPGLYEFGDAKVYIKQRDAFHDSYVMWLLYKDNLVTMDDGQMVLEPQEEGVALDEDDAFMSWTGSEEVTMSIFEIFNVLAIAGGGGNRSADDAYERGKLEGENKILKEWNQSLTGTSTTPSGGGSGRPNDDWTKYIKPFDHYQQPYRIGTGTGITYNTNQIMGDATTKTVLDKIDDTLDEDNVVDMSKYGAKMRDLYGLSPMVMGSVDDVFKGIDAS